MTTQFRSHNGTWRVASTERFQIGQRVTVERRNSQSSEVIIQDFLAHDPARELPFLYSFDDARRASGAQPTSERETIPNAARLFEMFERANEVARARPASHAVVAPRSIAVRFRLNSTVRGLRFELADTFNGSLLALTQERGRGGRRVTYGRLHRDGTYNARVGATAIEREIHSEVLQALRAFAADPARIAGIEGRQTGNCCFCGRGLTDERSVAVGYGPICADYYGLPWGEQQPSPLRAADTTGTRNVHTDELPAPAPYRPLDDTAFTERHIDQDGTRHINAQGEIINRTALGIDTATGEALDAWGRQFNVERRGRGDLEFRAFIIDQQRSIAAGAPSLEEIDRMPVGMGRAAAATQRASAGLPNAHRDSQGRLVADAYLAGLPNAHRDSQGRLTTPGAIPPEAFTAVNVNSGPPVRPDQVVTTVRRTRPRPAAPATAQSESFIASLNRRAEERRQARIARQATPAPTDETVITSTRRPRPNLNRPLEEDDFIWPPLT